jgi:hypothetical protein
MLDIQIGEVQVHAMAIVVVVGITRAVDKHLPTASTLLQKDHYAFDICHDQRKIDGSKTEIPPPDFANSLL